MGRAVILAGIVVGGVWAVVEGTDRPQPVLVQAPGSEVSTTTTMPEEVLRALEAINRALRCPDPAAQAALQRQLEEVLATIPPPPTVPGANEVVNIHRRVTTSPC